MKAVKSEDSPQPNAAIDYVQLANLYNELPLNSAVKMDEVYNISLFKRAIERRGLDRNKDFRAFSKKKSTYLVRLSETLMSKE